MASSCAQKLVYKKKGYDSSNDTDEYMMMLAQGGYIVGKMATMLFPEGIEVEGSTTERGNSIVFDCGYCSQDLGGGKGSYPLSFGSALRAFKK